MASQNAYLGSINLWPIPLAPNNWVLCQGQLLPISSYPGLFALIGTQFGGDGIKSFRLPSLIGCSPLGTGSPGYGTISNFGIGLTGGQITVCLTQSQLAPHVHRADIKNNKSTLTISVNNSAGDSLTPGGNYLAKDPAGTAAPYAANWDNCSHLNHKAEEFGIVTTTVTGNSLPFSRVPYYLTLNFIICSSGPYPVVEQSENLPPENI